MLTSAQWCFFDIFNQTSMAEDQGSTQSRLIAFFFLLTNLDN